MDQGFSSDEMSWHKVFTNVDYLQLMYYLVKYNPSLEVQQISNALKMNTETIQEMLIKLANLKIVETTNKQYTLTGRGLASLYNWHMNYNQ